MHDMLMIGLIGAVQVITLSHVQDDYLYQVKSMDYSFFVTTSLLQILWCSLVKCCYTVGAKCTLIPRLLPDDSPGESQR